MENKYSAQEISSILYEYQKILPTYNRLRKGWVQSFFQLPGERTCRVCSNSNLVIFPYPSLTKPFRFVYVYGCMHCGMSWVEKTSINLSGYYEKIYGTDPSHGRILSPGELFNKENMNNDKRAIRAGTHINQLYKILNKNHLTSILDFCCGPGFFLYLINAEKKYAVEIDEQCFKYLQYINANIIDLKKNATEFECICASHAIEHFFIDDIPDIFKLFHKSLMSDGILLIEVPKVSLLRHSIQVNHAPHVSFFTPEALDSLLYECGFKTRIFINTSIRKRKIREDCCYTPHKYCELSDTDGSLQVICSKIKTDSRLLDSGLSIATE